MTSDSAYELASAVENFLASAGARPLSIDTLGAGPLVALFEDPLTVVGLAIYNTVDELLDSWLDAQDHMARVIGRSESDLGAKAWDGYLVLATSQRSSRHQSVPLGRIRANTKRLRKLLIVGEDLEPTYNDLEFESAVARCLAPLAPLDLGTRPTASDPLEGLSSRIDVPGLDPSEIAEVVAAYRESRPLIQVIHERSSRRGAR